MMSKREEAVFGNSAKRGGEAAKSLLDEAGVAAGVSMDGGAESAVSPEGANTQPAGSSTDQAQIRLQKFLARAGVASRRASEELIVQGCVAVNGEVVRELGTKVDPRTDRVMLDGCPVTLQEEHVTIMLNKPAGVVTTMKAQSDQPIVADLVPLDRYPGLYPIGRLDADTTGLLLFSTDGELGHKLLHPSHHVSKTYVVRIKGNLTDAEADKLRQGVELDDGPTQPAQVEFMAGGRSRGSGSGYDDAHGQSNGRERGSDGGRGCGRGNTSAPQRDRVRITICEGRYHQVKRMFEAVGHPVRHLHRERIGSLALGDLKPGAWRVLSEKDLTKLFK